MEIFKAYDIRGLYPSELNCDIAYKIGRALVTYLKCKKVYVGHDMRESSVPLKEAFIKGVTDQGADVVDMGLCSTDMTYYASGKYDAASLMITASHNPAGYNGFKMCRAGGLALGKEDGLDQIKGLIEKDEFEEAEKGNVSEKEILDEYIETLLSFVDKDSIKKMKIVVDAGNGMAGKLIPKLSEKLPQLEIIPLYFELDGTFPNHPANPMEPENVIDLIESVKENKADIGLAFDGDADRVFLVDDNGKKVSASITGAMVTKSMLQKNPSSHIIHNVVCSRIVVDTIKKYSGVPVETKVGHSIIKPIMREKDAIFGTEHSGHYYFKDLFFADSGLLAALYILELVSKQGQKLSEALEEFRVYHAIEETNSKVEDKEGVLAKIAEMYKNNPEVISYKDFDGIRVDFKDWWFNVRPSNTEPLLRLNLEANTKELMEEKRDEILSKIRG